MHAPQSQIERLFWSFDMNALAGLVASAFIFTGAALASPKAEADVFTDDLSRCLISSTDDADKIAVMRWMFGAMSVHPELADLSSTTLSQRTASDISMARLFKRLMMKDCRTEADQLMTVSGESGFEAAFEVLGQSAMITLMNNDRVNEAILNYVQYLD
jgi:hypothetical protein